jgi:lipopolysaccharide heptosyltransferase I
LREGFPDAEISWVVERNLSEILRDNPLLDRLIEVDTKALRRVLMSGETLRAPRQQLRRLRASAFDVALDFQGLLKSASIARFSGARRVFGYSRAGLREPASSIFLSKRIPVPKQVHVIRKGLLLVEGALGIRVPVEPQQFSFPINVSAADENAASEAAHAIGGNYAILNPGGGWPTKLWSADRFGKLADALWSSYGLTSLVTHGPGEESLADAVRQASVTGRARPVSLSLKSFYSLAKGARVYVGGDTGPTHLAVAAGAPIVGLFGPTEWWRNGSPRPDDICVERTDIDCRVDCHRRSCSKWICMDIEVASVFRAVEKRLGK